MNNIQLKFNEIMHINRKRKIELEEDIDDYQIEKEVKRRREEQYENENFNLMTSVQARSQDFLRAGEVSANQGTNFWQF